MQLNVRDVARIMNVTESTVFRWLTEENLPAEEVNGQYRLNPAELLEWATLHRKEVPPGLFQTGNGNLPRLDEALRNGGVHHDVPGADRAAALDRVAELLPLAGEADRQMVRSVLLGREALGSTAIGNGLAIPHPRYPMVLPVPRPAITLCFLAQPIAYAAPDLQPVHTLFALVSPTVRQHNQLLARLACALRDPDFRQVVLARSSADVILQEAQRLEEKLRLPAGSAVEVAG